MATVTFTGTSGSLSHAVQFALNVQAASSSNAPPFRTRYIRTDATTEYFGVLNQNWTALDSARKHLFISDPWYGALYVVDYTTEKQVAKITVPGAFGIDITPDGSTVYVGTLLGDVYAIDTTQLTVSRRWTAAEIGPYGFSATAALVLSDGSLALLGSQGGIPSVDGSTAFAIWSPADNSMVSWGSAGLGSPLPCGQTMGNIGEFIRSGDRTKIVFGSIDSDATLCTYDITTQTATVTHPDVLWLWHVYSSPDGKKLVLPSGQNGSPYALVLNATTLEQITTFPIAGDNSSASSFFVGPDSNTLYVSSDTFVYAYDMTTGALRGWMPNLVVEPSSGGGASGPISGPQLAAMDSSGLLMGPMEEGVGFLDTATMKTGAVGTGFLNTYLSPPYGPASGGTKVTWQGANKVSAISKIYIGANLATSLTAVSGGISLSTPAGQPGVADFYALTTNGGMQIAPEAFSYGPTILQSTTNVTTADGGATAYLFGYGFGPTTSSAIPSDLAVSVGGTSAPVGQFIPNAYGQLAAPFRWKRSRWDFLHRLQTAI